MFFIKEDQKNMDGKCANIQCGFIGTRVVTKARWLDTQSKSWVCGACANSINRKIFSWLSGMKIAEEFKPRCISAEDATMLTLTGKLP